MAVESGRLTFNGDQVAEQLRQAAAEGLAAAAEHILQVSRTQVPKEEGTLERSGTVSVDDDTLQAAISYDTPYAVYQHEDMTLRHDDGRKAKYLEDPLNSERQTAGEIIAARIRRATQ